VQKIFTFIRSYGLRFVLRSGSSSTESLYANEKVVIDLSGVNHIEILKKCKLVPKSEEELRKSSASKFSCDDGKCDHSGLLRVGAGCLVGPTTEFLQESGYQLPIATLGHLSLLGLAINGGIGEFSREFGLLSDNIVAFYVLLPSEKIVRVDPKDNPDLFWALRGAGSGNFGIIIEMEIKIYPMTRLIQEFKMSFNPKEFVPLFANFQSFFLSWPRE